jgi:glyoxylase-like metal-dependent hydrolase (beta-lactamase superfamily II)
MSEPHDLPVLYRGPNGVLAGLHFDPSPGEALPQETFSDSYKLQANGETLALQHVPAAHTDTDIHVHFQNANVIQMADLFFNGMYPYIDPGTGGKITGVIAAAGKILSLADNDTKIVAGHGPLGNKSDLTKARDMLITGSRRGKVFRRSRPSLGQRHHQRRPVGPNRLFDVVNPPGKDYLPGEPSIRMRAGKIFTLRGIWTQRTCGIPLHWPERNDRRSTRCLTVEWGAPATI